MKLVLAILAFMNWYYIPIDSPSEPVEVEGIDMNLKRNELSFTFFSLSDGEAALIQHGNGESILINTGGNGTMPELERLLSLYKVKSIPTVIVTSREGLENLETIIDKYEVQQIVTGKKNAATLKLNANTIGVKISAWQQEDLQEVLPDLTAEVVYDGTQPNEGTDLSFRFFHHQIFYISSASQQSEQKFLNKPLKDVNIVKLPFYAGKGSFSDLLIQHLDPQIALIFKSKTARPDPDLLEMLLEAWIDVYFTKQHGTVTIKFTDSNYDVITILSKE
jgi:competence protein ComEC